MKILLLEHPRTVAAERCNDIANTPLCSCLLSGYIAAMLERDGHDVEIVEGFLDGLAYDEVRARIDASKADILGVHMVYNWEKDLALFAFLGKVKEELGPYIVAYGFYPTIAYRDILTSCAAIDAVIAGEPETAMARLGASDLRPDRIALIPGFVSRDGAGGFRVNEPEVVEDLDSMPFPVRTDGLMRLSEVNILGSRGCYGRCTFCYINTFFTRSASWRRRSPENIMEEIDRIIAQTKARDFYFTDANFFGPGARGQERALRIAGLLKARSVRFGIEGRVNDIKDETIAALADAGLRHILIGLESGRDESLKRLNKLTTVSQNEEALRILRKHGIEPNVGFIMFEPDSILDDLRVNFEFLHRNDLLGDLARTANVLYHHQIILEGTQAYHYLKEKGRLVPAASDYEGTTYFENGQVASLAAIMRRITNKLFSALDPVWSGRMPEPKGAKAGYERLNRLVVTIFDENLARLQKGEVLSDEEIGAIVEGAEEEIEERVGEILTGKGADPDETPKPAAGPLDLCPQGLQRSRGLRAESTKTETYLWGHLRDRRLDGFKFRRQHPIGKYIADFVSLEGMIIVEVDGGQHATEAAYDSARDEWLRSKGYRVLRFWDNDVFDNLEGVLETIRRALATPHPGPLPQGARES